MTMLTHSRGPFEPAAYSSGVRNTAGTGAAEAHLAMVKRFCMGALALLAVSGVAAAVIGLRTAIFFWRFHF